MSWCKIPCNPRELQLVATLSGGQSFRWKYDEVNDEWTGIFAKTVWKLRQSTDYLLFQVIGSSYKELHNKEYKSECDEIKQKIKKEDIFSRLLFHYFQFDVNLTGYFDEWAAKDAIFRDACQKFYGVRILNQEPVENIFSFICSQNNHISRISSMVEKLCTEYGQEICAHNSIKYYAFPDINTLANPKVESRLRELGFGYRAKFIQKSASQIIELGGEKWFDSLMNMEYKEARGELMKLHGIGPKVADCICLMSLKHLESVPIDTHVYQIAAKNYLPHLKGKKNVSEKMYKEIGDYFRELYGPLAGWAHTVLFCADLKKFQKNSTSEEQIGSEVKRMKFK